MPNKKRRINLLVLQVESDKYSHQCQRYVKVGIGIGLLSLAISIWNNPFFQFEHPKPNAQVQVTANQSLEQKIDDLPKFMEYEDELEYWTINNGKEDVKRPTYEIGLYVDIIRNGLKYKDLVEKIAKEYGLDVIFWTALITRESQWNENAKSEAGAIGLCQIMPCVAEQINKKYRCNLDLHIPKDNLEVGAILLRELFGRYNDKCLVLAGYNSGNNSLEHAEEQAKEYGKGNFWNTWEWLPAQTKTFVTEVLLIEKIVQNFEYCSEKWGLYKKHQAEKGWLIRGVPLKNGQVKIRPDTTWNDYLGLTNASTDELLKLNQWVKDINQLTVDKVLNIPGLKTYSVAQGDNLYMIAGCDMDNVEKIMFVNNMATPDINVGQVLVLPTKQ